jgi:uncharacterized damage-inducible protein DinB
VPESHARASAAADQLTKTANEILAEVERLPPDLIHWVPGEGVWTVMDNLCHIREFVPFWTDEAMRIVQRPSERWGRDQSHTGRLAAVTNTSAYRLDEVAADIRELVSGSAATLKTITDEQLTIEAASVNPRFGVKPASFVVNELLVHHMAKHQGQIRRNVSQFNLKAS